MPKTIEDQLQKAVAALRDSSEKSEQERKARGEESAEQKSMMVKHQAEVTKLQEQMNELATKMNRNNTKGSEPGNQSGEAMKKKEIFVKWMRQGKQSLTLEEKALVEDTEGEILVPEDLDNMIYTDKVDGVIMRQLASARNTSSNRIRRRGMNDVTAGWGKLETETSQKLEDYESTLTPTEDFLHVENLYGLTKIGEDELMDSELNLTQYLQQSFRRAFIRKENQGFLLGEGHSKQQPEGLLLDAGIKTLESEAVGSISADDFLKLMYQVHADYRRTGTFLTSSEIELHLRLLKDANGTYLWQPSAQVGKPNKFLGKDVFIQDDFKTLVEGGSVAVFGDFKEGYQILDRKGMSLTRLNEKYIEDDLIGFRAKQRVGGGVVAPKAFSKLDVKLV